MGDIRVLTEFLEQLASLLLHLVTDLRACLLPALRASRNSHLQGFLVDFLKGVCCRLPKQASLLSLLFVVSSSQLLLLYGCLFPLLEKLVDGHLLGIDFECQGIPLALKVLHDVRAFHQLDGRDSIK